MVCQIETLRHLQAALLIRWLTFCLVHPALHVIAQYRIGGALLTMAARENLCCALSDGEEANFKTECGNEASQMGGVSVVRLTPHMDGPSVVQLAPQLGGLCVEQWASCLGSLSVV